MVNFKIEQTAFKFSYPNIFAKDYNINQNFVALFVKLVNIIIPREFIKHLLNLLLF